MNELDQTLELLHRDARRAPAHLGEARAKLLAALDAEDTGVVVPIRRRRSYRHALPIAAAVAGVVAVTATVLSASPSEQAPSGGTDIRLMSAAQVLDKAADLTVGAVDQPVGPGQFRYVAEHGWVTGSTISGTPVGEAEQHQGYTYLQEREVQRWIPANATDTWQENRKILGKPVFLGGSVPQSQAPEPKVLDTDQGQRTAKCGDFFPNAKPAKKCGDPADWDSPAFYAGLPDNPDQLYAKLQELSKVKGSSPQVMFHYGVEILHSGLMPAELRAQWYRALAKIPGIKVLAAETNLDGRAGVALGLDDEHVLRQLIIDPATGQFIGERTVAGAQPSDPWIKPGTELGASAITTGVADSLGVVPAK